LPLPLLSDVIDIQSTPSVTVAVQPQSPADEVTVILPLPPLAGNELLVGEIKYVQGTPS
jgi:hypothetical protein